jgi:hypothetical protein
MSLSQSSQSGATMFFFWSISRYSLQSSCFKKNKKVFITIGARNYWDYDILHLICLSEARRISACWATFLDSSLNNDNVVLFEFYFTLFCCVYVLILRNEESLFVYNLWWFFFSQNDMIANYYCNCICSHFENQNLTNRLTLCIFLHHEWQLYYRVFWYWDSKW